MAMNIQINPGNGKFYVILSGGLSRDGKGDLSPITTDQRDDEEDP